MKSFGFAASSKLTLVCTLGLASLSLNAPAQIVTLVDGNSVARVDTGSSAGMFSWTVDGINQLTQQWFWYRVGGVGPESPINTIGAPVISTPNARSLTTTYANASYSIGVDYLLTGSLPGSGKSDVLESIRIRNTSASALEFHFFQYSDFDLGGVVGGQNVQLGRNLQGKFNEAFQTVGNITLSEQFVDSVNTPGADHGEAAFFNSTLVKLNDGVASTLNDAAGPIGPGDVTWAFEWDLTILPGATVTISKDKLLQVPEPPALAIAALGCVALVWLRRNRVAQ